MMSKADHPQKPPSAPFVAADQGGSSPAELARIAERNRLIVQIMEINAKQRHLESMQIGLTLEVNRLLKTQDRQAADLKAQLKSVEDQLRRLAAQRDFLETSLAEIDGAPGAAPGSSGGKA